MQPKHTLLTLVVLSSTSSIAHAFQFQTPQEVALNTETTIEWTGQPSLGDVAQSVVLIRDEQAVLTLCQGQITGSGQCSFTLSESDRVQGKGYYLGLRGDEDGLTIDISKQFEIVGGEESVEAKGEEEVVVEEVEEEEGREEEEEGGEEGEEGREEEEEGREEEVVEEEMEEEEEEVENERYEDKKDKKNRHHHHEDHEEENDGEEDIEVKDKDDDRRGHHHHHKDIDVNQGGREHKKQFEYLRRQAEAARTKEEALREEAEKNVPTPTVPQPAVPTGDVKTMAMPPIAQPTAIPVPIFSILPFSIRISTDKVEIMPIVPTGVVPPLPLLPIPTEAPTVDDGANHDGDFEAASVACEGGERKVHAKGKHAQHDKKKYSGKKDSGKKDSGKKDSSNKDSSNKDSRKKDSSKKDSSKRAKGEKTVHAAEAKKEEPTQKRQAETAWKAVLNGVKNIGSTASDYFSQLKSLALGKNEVENESDNAAPKAARKNKDL
ncbi:hypothetical protein BG005_002010 [Podila minutissima]|nr:hypothetical protein BG005_002010 [Podila minutissima]